MFKFAPVVYGVQHCFNEEERKKLYSSLIKFCPNSVYSNIIWGNVSTFMYPLKVAKKISETVRAIEVGNF